MKAISIWQPHASLLLIGAKPFETRSWPVPKRLIGQRVAIHAAKAAGDLIEIGQYVLDRMSRSRFDEQLEAYVSAILGAGFRNCRELPRGCILGSVILSESLAAESAEDHHGFGDFRPGRFAWRVADSRVLPNPIPFRGMQGFFDVPDRLLDDAA